MNNKKYLIKNLIFQKEASCDWLSVCGDRSRFDEGLSSGIPKTRVDCSKLLRLIECPESLSDVRSSSYIQFFR